MAYPYLPVNPCCTDVVLNSPCGCSSTITNSGCNNNDPCSTHLTASSTIVYDGPALTCTTAEPCDTLNVILQKIDQIICNLLTQINILTNQVTNITTQIITINGDIINIYNQLGECCTTTTSTSSSSTSTTTSTTTIHPCENFSLDNTGVDPVAIIITNCDTGEPEAIILNPGDTNICVVTDSPLTVPGTIIVTPNGPCLPPTSSTTSTTSTSTSSTSSTTTTTTTAIPCECLTFENQGDVSHIISYLDCDNSSSRPIQILPNQIIKVCGSEGEASSPNVTITIGENCIDKSCPADPTTTSTTTLFCTRWNWNLTGINPETLVTIEWDECGGEGDTHIIITQPAGDFDNPFIFCSETFPIITLGSITSEGPCEGTTSSTTTTSSTSSTTTTSTTIEPTTSTTTSYSGCRPQGLTTIEYFNSYDDGSGVVDYTGSLLEACTACSYVNTIGPAETSLFGQSVIFAVGQLVYAGTGTSCELLANGFYITNHEPCEVTEIVDGYIVSITTCSEITTTTSSSSTSTSTSSTTSTSSSTTSSTSTTSTTAYPYGCTCMQVTISQTDLDDATGNTPVLGLANNTVYLRTSKNSGCDDSEVDAAYTTAGVDGFCIKTSAINTIQLFYYKNNVPIYFPAIASTYNVLYSDCSVNATCIPT